MNLSEVSERIGTSKLFLGRILDSEEICMVECTMLKSQLAFNKLDLLNRFQDQEAREEENIQELMKDL